MASIPSITAADSVYILTILNLFPPQVLGGYTADAAFETEAVEPAEIVMGVDGRMSAGWVPTLTKQTISIMPDSPTSLMFEDWMAAQKAARTVYQAAGLITLNSTGRVYVLTNGVLTRFQSIPGAKKVLQGRMFEITWGDVSAAPV